MGKTTKQSREDFLTRADKMAAMYELGNSCQEIAAYFTNNGNKISRQRVSQILQKRKIILKKMSRLEKTATPVAAL